MAREMEKYEEVKIELFMFENIDTITDSDTNGEES